MSGVMKISLIFSLLFSNLIFAKTAPSPLYPIYEARMERVSSIGVYDNADEITLYLKKGADGKEPKAIVAFITITDGLIGITKAELYITFKIDEIIYNKECNVRTLFAKSKELVTKSLSTQDYSFKIILKDNTTNNCNGNIEYKWDAYFVSENPTYIGEMKIIGKPKMSF